MSTMSMQTKPVIALFGANGQVGYELRRALAPLGTVHAITREQVDLRQPRASLAVLDAIKPQIIVNAAAYTAVDKAESEPEIAYAVNTLYPEDIAVWANNNRSLIVHYSTDYVFDGAKPIDQNYTEEDTPNPQSVYGKTKLQGEQAVQASGADHLIFRTSWVFGAHGNNFAKTMLKLASERDALRVVADQWGAPTSAALIADTTAHAIQAYLQDKDKSGLYHLTASGVTNWCEYARFVIAEAKGKGMKVRASGEAIAPITTAEYPTPAKRPANSRMSTHKISETFVFKMPEWQLSVTHLIKQIITQ